VVVLNDRLRAHVAALVGERHPLTTRAALLKAEQYLISQLTECRLQVSTHAAHAFGRTYRNIIGTAPASSTRRGPDDAPMILAAHYDTAAGSPGADDNASGLAVMLEVARLLGSAPRIRPVRFIGFCLEEQNLFGSLAYAASLQASHQRVYGAIVLECVGYTSGSQLAPPGTPVAVPPTGDFLAVVGNTTSAELITLMESASRQAGVELKMVSLIVTGQGEQFPDARRSDHAAFWQYGYRAIMLTDTANYRNPHYHQPSDLPQTLDYRFMERVTAAVTATVRAMAGPSP
jgi:Zn-dependent M28 family amino/carboxypeptidase